eukprot:1584823-Amphidinium_carterae.2
MEMSDDAQPSEFADTMQTDTKAGAPPTKRLRATEDLRPVAAAQSSGDGLGEPAKSPLQMRRVEQRRWIFQQRGQKCPDNWPSAGHPFEEGRNYTS